MQVKINGTVQRVTGKAARIIRAQPGYIASRPKMLSRTSAGGIRLFVVAAGQWMDASLADINDEAVTSLVCDKSEE